jgi:hypothetical protein
MEFNSEYENYINDLSKRFSYYASIIIFPIGLTLNIISFIIFRQKGFENTNIGFFGSIIAVLDSCASVLSFIQTQSSLSNNDLSLASRTGCKLMPYLIRVFAQVLSWLQALAVFERVITVKYQNTNELFKNRKFLSLCIVLIAALILLINLPNVYFELDVQQAFNSTTNKSTISKSCRASSQLEFARDLIAWSNSTVVPFIFIMTFLIILIINYNKTKSSITEKVLKREFNFAFVVITLTICFFVALIPMTIRLIIKIILNKEQSSSAIVLAQANFAHVVTIYYAGFIGLFSFALNLKFNAVFREELERIISKVWLLRTNASDK